MGLCTSSELSVEQQAAADAAKERSKVLDKEMHTQDQADAQVNKLLLLGAGDSGKSTLFKQMKSIYGSGFTERERRSYISSIHNNIILSIKSLTAQAANYGGIVNQESKQAIVELKEDTVLDENIAHHIRNIWGEKAVQEAYAHRSLFQLSDSTFYYFAKLEEVVKVGYVPSPQDVLRSRVPTTGIIENAFEIDGNLFRMWDVGGQRSERKKWIHCFEGVTAVLFVASISAYDQFLYEDAETSHMTEALALYEDISNSEWFHETAVILFLNKKDLFKEKIEVVPLKDYFPAYTGKTYEEATEFVMGLFKDRNHQFHKDFYYHVTCATDTNQIRDVFNDVKDIIIKRVLKVLM